MFRRSRFGLLASLVILTSAIAASPVAAVPAGNDNTVLILGSTVTGGATSREALAAIGLGLAVTVVDDTTWAAMTAADFGSYRAIILGDPTCSGTPATFAANEATWGPQVDGNVVLIGTDPIFHESQGGGALTDKGIAFATTRSGKTGLYATLSCYYHGTAALTPVPAFNSLSSLGVFTVTGVGCFNDAHIVATHPALAGLTDADLSNWSCSVHEAFDTWPSDFQVLAIAKNFGGSFTAGDGTVGTPYILARGEGLVPIGFSLTPTSAENPVGTNHTVTATILKGGVGVAGIVVHFSIVSGPSAPLAGDATTGADGKATFTWSSATTGVDVIVASYVDATTKTTVTSNRATKTWFEAKKVPSTILTKTPSKTVVGYGGSVTYTYTEKNDGEVDLLNPSVVDDKCSPVTGVIGLDLIHNVGDTNLDGILSIGETWTFTCSMRLLADTTNTAVAHGFLSDGTDVTWCADPTAPPKGVFCDQQESAKATVDVNAGCSHGYWKQSQHFTSWVGYTPSQLFSSVFENAFGTQTLLQVLQNKGGGLNALGRETVAALLNAANPTVSGIGFPYTTAQVIAAFNAVYPGGDYETLKNAFEAANTIGCPLS